MLPQREHVSAQSAVVSGDGVLGGAGDEVDLVPHVAQSGTKTMTGKETRRCNAA